MAFVHSLARLKSRAAVFKTPSIRNYNRLEVSPRSNDFESNLAMRAHDPMWFLSRQWQFGEFQGEDAGTPYQANVLGVHTQPGEITFQNGASHEFGLDEALETYVEKEELLPTLFLRAQMGRHLSLLLTEARLKRYVPVIARLFPLVRDVDDDDEEGRYFAAALGTDLPDGFVIFEEIRAGNFRSAYEADDDVEADDLEALAEVEVQFFNWFVTLYCQPQDRESAWDPAHLEYGFSLSARGEQRGGRRLLADQYASGHLDWQDFDQVDEPRRRRLDGLPEPETVVQTFLPAALKFSGMPHPRLWQMEEGTVNFGKLSASPTSLLNVLLAQFGLNYSNDWFVLPYELPINTLCSIKGLVITDVFGQHLHVRPAIEDPESDWQKFAMFHQTERDNATAGESRFYLPPSVGQRLQSEDVERVNFIRDEMSNMAWGIEQVVASDAGPGRLLKRTLPTLSDFEPGDEISKVRYVLGNTVPDNWIPFVPAHSDSSQREIRLQRAKMPNARGAQGKMLNEVQPVYFIEEEEVPRSGVLVSRNFQRTRWLGGKTLLWMGRRKRVGSGEGIANLVFDSIRDIRDER